MRSRKLFMRSKVKAKPPAVEYEGIQFLECPECGEELEEGFEVCPKCGKEISRKFTYCPYCRNKTQEQ